MKNVDWKLVKFLEKKALDVDPTIHFNPEKYSKNIDIKLQSYKTSRHQKYMANFHIVWTIRGRCKILFKEARTIMKEFIEQEIEKQENWQLLTCEVMPEHIHMFVSLNNVTHPYQFVGIVRKNVAKKMITCFPIIERALGKTFFNRSFYWGTIGNVTGVGVLNYIHKQWKEFSQEQYYRTKEYLNKKNKSLKQFF